LFSNRIWSGVVTLDLDIFPPNNTLTIVWLLK